MATDNTIRVSLRCACGSAIAWEWGFAPPRCPGCGRRVTAAEVRGIAEDVELVRSAEAAKRKDVPDAT